MKLLICESPNKIQTLKEFLPKDFLVMASAGHISQIKDGGSYWNTGIEPLNDFKTSYAISPDKKEKVRELKEAVTKADFVYLASDPDNEGEAIAWSLKKFLNIPDSKYARVTFHEITKSAVLKALQNPEKINNNIVDAAQSRAILDKLIGYRCSPISRKYLNAKSVGRCQSAALQLVVNREKEILNFIPETYYDLNLFFNKNGTKFKAKFIGPFNDPDKNKVVTADECNKIKSECSLHSYIISDIINKEGYENPAAPFTTSTYQQEVNKKLGFSVKVAMSTAQKLFEGINIGGKHIGLVTYLRTDSTEMSDEFKPILESYVANTFGKEYVTAVRKFKQKDNSQQGHECFRVVDPEMTPEKLSTLISDQTLLKIYELIWKRTIACAMKSAVVSNTEYLIKNNNYKFILKSKEYLFDGFKKIYTYKEMTEEDSIVKEVFSLNEVIYNPQLVETKQETKPASRYKESTFIKELESSGIGRPSTFAKILETLLSESRGYCIIEDKCIKPTELGMKLADFLEENLNTVISISYTAEMEKDLDLIADGKLKKLDFLNNFYNGLETTIKNNLKDVTPGAKICPECGAPMKLRHGQFGDFFGCSSYPNCKHTEKIIK